MSELKGPGGELRCTVTITRKATGKVETVELVGHTTPEQHAAIVAGMERSRVHGSEGSMGGAGANLTNKENDDEHNP